MAPFSLNAENRESYWQQSSKEVTRTLPGERLLTPQSMLLVSGVEGFKGLVRETMERDFHDKNLKPGDLYVTHIRGFPLINVTAQDGDEPQVVWMKEFLDGEKKMNGSQLVKRIAFENGRTLKAAKNVLNYAYDEIAGRNVNDPKSPIRIVPNLDHPVGNRPLSYNAQGGNAENSVAEASLTEPMNGIGSAEQARDIIRLEAERIGVPVDQMLHPKKIGEYLKDSAILRQVIKFMSEGAGH